MTDQAKDENISFEEAMKLIDENLGLQGPGEEENVIWAEVLYEEGTSGPLQQASGVLVDNQEGITLINPDTGNATIVGDRFLVRVDLVTIEVEDDEDDDDDSVEVRAFDPDALDTSADRFRA